MAQFGFESNDSYDYQLRCLLDRQTSGLRCLNVEGRSTRRKTAFANALARALDYPHLLYYDFTQHEAPFTPAPLPNHDQEEGAIEEPISAFDRVVSEACAFSEADPAVLILDQLQAADFRHHIRLYEFAATCVWTYSLATLRANPKNLLIFLISEEPLYHSLQKASFRVWVEDSHTHLQLNPADFGLDDSAVEMMAALTALFQALGTTPTQSELKRIIHDVLHIAHTESLLRHSIYGWTEGVDRERLYSTALDNYCEHAMRAIERYIGFDEIHVEARELGGGAPPVSD